jgi:hypothetical protein
MPPAALVANELGAVCVIQAKKAPSVPEPPESDPKANIIPFVAAANAFLLRQEVFWIK